MVLLGFLSLGILFFLFIRYIYHFMYYVAEGIYMLAIARLPIRYDDVKCKNVILVGI